jgi:carbonic anhydrase/acetyltransferase-like protein (isoleucine patch superfamily)
LIIGANATIGNNLTLGSNLSIGNNTTIGNNLIVGNNALIKDNLGIGNLAVIGNNLTIGTNANIGNNLIVGNNALVGNNLGIGNNAVIGNQLIVGTNAQIGGNLTVAGLITSANLNANTVQTVTMVPNSATLTSGYQGAAYEIASPTVVYAGFDGTYYDYQTANLVIPPVAITCTTANVTNVISGYIDVYGVTTSTVNFIPQMYAELYRVIGANVTPLPGTFITTAAYNVLAPGSDYTTQSEFPIRVSEVSIIDIFTITPPQTVEYVWIFGSFVGVTSNTAPTQNYIGQNGWSMTITNYRR